MTASTLSKSAITSRTLMLTAVAMFAFAANSIFCRMALAQTRIDPATFTMVRICAGALVLAVLCRARGASGIKGDWRSALALLAYAAFFSFAYVSLTAATGALLLFGAVQATMIATGLLRGERLSAVQWSGFLIAIVALISLLAPGVSAPDPYHAALMLAAGVSWGAYSLFGRGTADPLATTAGNFVRAIPLAAALLLIPVLSWDASGILWAVLSGAVASGMGYAIWYSALPGLAATQAATVQLGVPVITALSGVVVLGERLTLRLVLTSAVVLLGIALVVRARPRAA